MKTVIFDFDGTLADSVSIALRLYNDFSDVYGVEQINGIDEARQLLSLGYAKAMKAKKITPLKLITLVRLASKEMPKHMPEVVPYSGIVETVSKLKSQGYGIGVLTSNQEAIVRGFLSAHKFPEFDFVVSEKTLFRKDKALKKIIKKYKLSTEEIVFVGDEPRDMQAAAKLGVKSVGVTWGLAGVEGFGKSQPDILVNSASEIVQAIG
ncbi:HAD-IA family hydrolase [Candidatus Saccharibacteria bacterium]|nr:HAD-IA family hydrolase [Candidatus Saccharibacteria bacterium]